MGGEIGHGVLTYALLHDGLWADPKLSGVDLDKDGRVTLGEWLEYPVKRVPELFDQIRNHKVDTYGVPVTRTALNVADPKE